MDGSGLLFALGMKIDSTYFSLDLVETDVIEAFKRGPNYCSNSVVWNQKVLLPSHENVISLCQVRDGDGPLAGYLLVWPESAKLGPVANVHFVVCAPVVMLGEEIVLCADDFSLEIGGQCWVVLGQAYPKRARLVSYDATRDLCRIGATNLGCASSRRGRIRAGQHA